MSQTTCEHDEDDEGEGGDCGEHDDHDGEGGDCGDLNALGYHSRV